jgi:CO/xanthine dehydrogenase Mo-binding subunit
MPGCPDLPMLDTVMVEVPNPKHPQGVKGVGEAPLVSVMAAVANAIHNALGKSFYSLPMVKASISAARVLLVPHLAKREKAASLA